MTDKIIELAIQEDLGLGDLTSDNIFTEKDKAKAYFLAKEDMIVCGLEVAREVFEYVDKTLRFKALAKDGQKVKKGAKLAEVLGSVLGILKGERTALNFMQRMSGIATLSSRYAAAGAKYGVMITDTRKCLPAFRKFDKYAVRCGGARNHRMSLSDGVLIKENHIEAAGGIAAAVNLVRSKIGHTPKIEVEVKNKAEILEALEAAADIIMLDNMTPAQVKEAKKIIGSRAIVEASGGITLANLEEYCKMGVDVISVGALTHSAGAKDISLLLEHKGRKK